MVQSEVTPTIVAGVSDPGDPTTAGYYRRMQGGADLSRAQEPARARATNRSRFNLTAKTQRTRREKEMNKFARFLGVLGVFAVKIGVEPPGARDRDVLERRERERGDLAGKGRVRLCGNERVSGICGADGVAPSLFGPDRPNSCAKKIKS
jgi:hypothetical protein